LTFQVSLSKLFNDHLECIKESEDPVTYKRVAQNIKATVKNLEKLEKSGITVHEMTMRNDVPLTKYTVVYKVKVNPKKKLIAKKVLKHR